MDDRSYAAAALRAAVMDSRSRPPVRAEEFTRAQVALATEIGVDPTVPEILALVDHLRSAEGSSHRRRTGVTR